MITRWNHVSIDNSFLKKSAGVELGDAVVESWVDAEEEQEESEDAAINSDVPLTSFLFDDIMLKMM